MQNDNNNSSRKKRPFTQTPNMLFDLIKEKKINATDKLIYDYLIYSTLERDSLCHYTQVILSKNLGINRKTVGISLNKLRELELVEFIDTSKIQNNNYGAVIYYYKVLGLYEDECLNVISTDIYITFKSEDEEIKEQPKGSIDLIAKDIIGDGESDDKKPKPKSIDTDNQLAKTYTQLHLAIFDSRFRFRQGENMSTLQDNLLKIFSELDIKESEYAKTINLRFTRIKNGDNEQFNKDCSLSKFYNFSATNTYYRDKEWGEILNELYPLESKSISRYEEEAKITFKTRTQRAKELSEREKDPNYKRDKF